MKVLKGGGKSFHALNLIFIKDTTWAIKKEVKKVIDIVPVGLDEHEYFYHHKKGNCT